MGVGCGDLRVQCWNVNSMMKTSRSWVKFVNRLKNSNENIFILVDSRFETEQEIEFRKLWDGPIFYNSQSSNQRGIIVLIKDSFVCKKTRVLQYPKGRLLAAYIHYGWI